jgi:hypothetical protein
MLEEEKTTSKDETIGNKVDRIWNRITGIGKKVSDAIEEDAANEEDSLISVSDSVLDFNLVEQDVKRIHKKLEREGSRVLGSYLILDNKQDTMQIQTYKQSGDKTFVNTMETKVTRVSNLPTEVLAELKEKGVVKLHLKLE